MSFICLILATLLFLMLAYLFLSADRQIGGLLVMSLCENEQEKIRVYKQNLTLMAARIKAAKDARRQADPALLRRGKTMKKKMDAAEKQLQSYQKSGVGILDIPPIAGYRVLQMLRLDVQSGFLKHFYTQCMQFKEKKEAMNQAYYLAASLIGNLLLGVCLLFLGMGFGIAMNMGSKSLIIGGILFAIFALLGYIPCDTIASEIKKRAESIQHDFPRAISKLTLLTVSGMEVNDAWRLVAKSNTGVLYVEMSRVITDIDNNVSPVVAYASFIKRCNNPYTTKLASAIMQNLTKGNAEIVMLLRGLNNECWSEYKHHARRMGEKISSKLLFPTLLLFVGILILVIVPVVSGLNL